MTTEIQYPIRGSRWGDIQNEYYYLQEHGELRLGDTVKSNSGDEGELIAIVHLVKINNPDYFVGVIRVNRRVGERRAGENGYATDEERRAVENGYATELGEILGIPNYGENTTGHNLKHVRVIYSGPCRGCISTCKGEEICAFYRED